LGTLRNSIIDYHGQEEFCDLLTVLDKLVTSAS
jgi:hypothetical protein